MSDLTIWIMCLVTATWIVGFIFTIIYFAHKIHLDLNGDED